MNAVDATSREDTTVHLDPPALLTIILDTNPHAWNLLQESLPLHKAVANLLVFINAHLAINHANRVAVLASHSERAEWLYPTPAQLKREENGDVDMEDGGATGPGLPPDDANKYRPFAHMEHALLSNLRRLAAMTTTPALQSTPATMMAGALTLAMSHISKQTASIPTTAAQQGFNYSDASATAGGNDLNQDPTGRGGRAGPTGLQSRILILSVSGDLAQQYIPIMNSIFACQRLSIPIDILKLAGDAVFLQQAADATNGIYTALKTEQHGGLLQHLMMAYLPDQTARAQLIVPGEEGGVDFRAACFCHQRTVDIGYVCSICLSIFCEPLADQTCLTCGSQLRLGEFGKPPVVVPKKKKKKKRPLDGVDTPGSGPGTPVAV